MSDSARTPLAEILRPQKPKTPPLDSSTKASAPEGGWRGDVLEDARRTIVEVMRGKVQRGAQARLAAAKMILAEDFLSQLSDDALLAEVKRRTDAAAEVSKEEPEPVENES